MSSRGEMSKKTESHQTYYIALISLKFLGYTRMSTKVFYLFIVFNLKFCLFKTSKR